MNIRGHVKGFASGVTATLIALGAIAGGFTLYDTRAVSPTMDEIAEQFAVDIIWTDDLRNCGVEVYPYGGCWHEQTPNTIYVSADITDVELERTIVLHEIGHVMQHRLGQPSNECAADRFALSLGASQWNYCTPAR